MKEFRLRLHEIGRESFEDWTYTILANVDQTEITKRIRDGLRLEPLVKPLTQKEKTLELLKLYSFSTN